MSDKPPDDDSLIIDELGRRLAQLRLLYDDDAATDKILNQLGGQGRVERDIVRHLASTQTLAFPERFVDAHRVAMHALEVLARNGSRQPSQLRLGPLTGVVRFLAQQVIRPIVRGHQGQVVDSLRDLYTRRLGWMPADDPYRMVVVRARMDVERATPSYKKKVSVLPTALAGGAAASSLAQAFRGAGVGRLRVAGRADRGRTGRVRAAGGRVLGGPPRGGYRPPPHPPQPRPAPRRPVGDGGLVR